MTGAVHGRGVDYGTAYRNHQALVQQLKQARSVATDLERQVEHSQMRLTKAQRLLLEEAQQA